MKNIIWSNLNLNLKDYEDYFETELGGGLTEDEKVEEMYNLNSMYLEAERANLNIQLDNDILVLGDLGLWNGRVSGCKIIEGGLLSDILMTDSDLAEWYVESNELKSIQAHHDGTNYLTYRKINSDIYEEEFDDLLDAIYNNRLTEDMLQKHTVSLGQEVKDIYGW